MAPQQLHPWPSHMTSLCRHGGTFSSPTRATTEFVKCVSIRHPFFDTSHTFLSQVDSVGIIITIAGNTTSKYYGDGLEPLATRLSSPQGVAINSMGDIFIADTFNHRIRKVLFSSSHLRVWLCAVHILDGVATDRYSWNDVDSSRYWYWQLLL